MGAIDDMDQVEIKKYYEATNTINITTYDANNEDNNEHSIVQRDVEFRADDYDNYLRDHISRNIYLFNDEPELEPDPHNDNAVLEENYNNLDDINLYDSDNAVHTINDIDILDLDISDISDADGIDASDDIDTSNDVDASDDNDFKNCPRYINVSTDINEMPDHRFSPNIRRDYYSRINSSIFKRRSRRSYAQQCESTYAQPCERTYALCNQPCYRPDELLTYARPNGTYPFIKLFQTPAIDLDKLLSAEKCEQVTYAETERMDNMLCADIYTVCTNNDNIYNTEKILDMQMAAQASSAKSNPE